MGPRRKERSPKSKPSSFWRERLNFKHAWENLMWILAANFKISDWHVVLTYADECLPPNRDAAVKRLKKFNRQMREGRKTAKRPYKYVYVTEGQHGDMRLHHHLVINRYPGDIAVIRSLWPDGNVDAFPRVCGGDPSEPGIWF